MGSGKSTVGALVAEALGWEFVDMDGLIEARAGRPVARIFEADGEAAFREAERGVAQSLGSRERLVVAAGGGAFAEAATRQALQHQALTVWLKCDLETVLERIPADGRRPLARNREIMRGLLAQREASYRLADLAVEAGGGPPRAVAEAVIAALRDRGLLRET
jgi:shikimate kinase